MGIYDYNGTPIERIQTTAVVGQYPIGTILAYESNDYWSNSVDDVLATSAQVVSLILDAGKYELYELPPPVFNRPIGNEKKYVGQRVVMVNTTAGTAQQLINLIKNTNYNPRDVRINARQSDGKTNRLVLVVDLILDDNGVWQQPQWMTTYASAIVRTETLKDARALIAASPEWEAEKQPDQVIISSDGENTISELRALYNA